MQQFQELGHVKPDKEFRGRSAFIVQIWWIVQGTLFAWSPQFLYGWRNLLLRIFGAKIGENVRIRPSAWFTYPWKVSIGNYCRIGDNTILYSLGEISIGNHSVISQQSYVCAGSHDYTSVTFDLFASPVRIADQVWVAADVFIAPGVSIGTGSVVGARSTVLYDLPGGMICYGNPAKPIKKREIKEK